jgi:1,4-alpha-glucan branching enzyme
MDGYLSLVLHAHLPFVRHPEHERFLEENWLYEAVIETYVPLLQIFEQWQRESVRAPITLTLTPTLCSMLRDPLLQERCSRRLQELIDLAEQEVHRTHFEKTLNSLATFYHQRFRSIQSYYENVGRDLVAAFKRLQDAGLIEIITSAATHALLPMLASHPPSIRAQLLAGRDHYRSCFGRDPRGIWLPECAYIETLDTVLREAELRWFILDTHGILHASPRPRYATFAPVITPTGLAAFGRDVDSARQVWSRNEGYPGDPRYRDFYRDIGFDLEQEYVRPYLPGGDKRGFTGLKYYRITGGSGAKEPYDRKAALAAADLHAGHFLDGRVAQVKKLAGILDRPALIVAPYDAELFGHWWYEGPEFLDLFARKAAFDQKTFLLLTPEQYLERHPTNQVATPAASSWGEGGYWGVWLNEKSAWIYPELASAQDRMTELSRRFTAPDPLQHRALQQAGRELLLAQSSDWPFIMRTGTSPEYARQRINTHLCRFSTLYDQLISGQPSESQLADFESQDNLFPDLKFEYWR